MSRTKVESLKIHCRETFSLQNGRRLATVLERCTCIPKLFLELSYDDRVELLQILLLELIPKMLGLKILQLQIHGPYNQQFFDIAGQCIEEHQGEIEELMLMIISSLANPSIVGLAPALRRLKVIRFHCYTPLSSLTLCELSGIVADRDTLEEFAYNILSPLNEELEEFGNNPRNSLDGISIDDFKAICQLWSRFPSLKRLSQQYYGPTFVDLREERRFTAFLEMVKSSKTIEQVPVFRCSNAEDEAAIKHHCCNNRIHNQIRENDGLLAAKVPSYA